jgi:hypothetical protein
VEPSAHVQCVIDGLSEDLSDEETKRAADFIHSRADAFFRAEFDLGRSSIIPHQIDTGNNHPVRQQLRRHPLALRQFIDDEVKKMLAHDIIEPTASPWSSNEVLVSKKAGQLRFCIDFRNVIPLTYEDAYPLPKIDTCPDMLGGARLFPTLDLRCGYWQVEIEDSDRDKTAFVARMGQYCFKVLP